MFVFFSLPSSDVNGNISELGQKKCGRSLYSMVKPVVSLSFTFNPPNEARPLEVEFAREGLQAGNPKP